VILLVASSGVIAAALEQVKLTAARFPGEHELTVVVRTPEQALTGGEARRLTLGPLWTYDGSAACLAALAEFGQAEVRVG